MFIVQGKPREPEGIVKVTKATREDALEAANDFLNQGMPFVTIVADGRVYTRGICAHHNQWRGLGRSNARLAAVTSIMVATAQVSAQFISDHEYL